MPQRVVAFAPASIGNLGVGFDMLGLAIEGAGDRVVAQRKPEAGVTVSEVRAPSGERHPALSTDAKENTAAVAAEALWAEHGDGDGIDISVHKGVPLQSGMGSSAASAVAGAVAANGLLDEPLAVDSLLGFALAGEHVASGSFHADNVAPSLLGGLVFCPPPLDPKLLRIDAPPDLCSVLLHPDLSVNTAEARRGLAPEISIDQWLTQQSYLAGFLIGLARNDHDLIRDCLKDVIIEPQRAAAVPCFHAVKGAALEAGALGSSLSGSGPSIFALAAKAEAEKVSDAMISACREAGLECDAWVSSLSAPGARLETVE